MPQTTPAWFFFGDSLTQGVDDCLMPGGWVSRLAVLAHEAGLCPIPRATFYNLGARRHGTANIASRWRHELESRLIPGLEPRLVFCVGVVDMVAPGGGTAADPAQAAALLQPVLGVREEYLGTALERVRALGGLDSYLALIGIGDDDRQALADWLVRK